MTKHTITQRHMTTYRLALLASILALVVVVLGAFTRLTDAGLGCPDWPGCYGHVVVPHSTSQINEAVPLYASTPLEPRKAWAEMVHRYFAGSLVLLCIAIAFISFRRSTALGAPRVIPLLLLLMLAFQAALGMWTVTWKLLPVVVMGHLMGGMTILSLLWLLALSMTNIQPKPQLAKFKGWVLLALLIVITQIALGGWVSSNYAALICPTFPNCNGTLLPTFDFAHAFNFFSPIGANYFGGKLDTMARVTIQMTHRYGAFITATYVGILALWLFITTPALRRVALAALVILLLQFSLGVLNVLKLLPLPIAVAHNAMGALLLLTMVTLNYCVFIKQKRV